MVAQEAKSGRFTSNGIMRRGCYTEGQSGKDGVAISE